MDGSMFYLKRYSGGGNVLVIQDIDQPMRYAGVPYSTSKFGFMAPDRTNVTSRIIETYTSDGWSFYYNYSDHILYVNQDATLIEMNYEEE